MICVQLGAVHQDAVCTFVQVWNLLWEPRYITHIWEEKSDTELSAADAVHHYTCNAAPAGFPLPSSRRQELSGGSISTTFTCFRSSWMISFSCSWLLSQSTKISNSELRLLDFLDSMCTRLTWFSWNRHYKSFLSCLHNEDGTLIHYCYIYKGFRFKLCTVGCRDR